MNSRFEDRFARVREDLIERWSIGAMSRKEATIEADRIIAKAQERAQCLITSTDRT